MSDFRTLYCNTPAALHLPGRIMLLPGPNGNKVPVAVWDELKTRESVQRVVYTGQLTGETAGYRPMIAKRPRKVANPRIDLDEETAAPRSRRAHDLMVAGGVPDQDLIAEIRGLPTSTEMAIDLANLQEYASGFAEREQELKSVMERREAQLKAEADERLEAERKAADERLEAERKAADERLEALRTETERELASMRARIEALNATPTPPDPTPVPDEPADEGEASDGQRVGRRRRG